VIRGELVERGNKRIRIPRSLCERGKTGRKKPEEDLSLTVFFGDRDSRKNRSLNSTKRKNSGCAKQRADEPARSNVQ